MKIGIAGIGKMGSAIAARLSGVGHEMMVWNRSADKAKATGFRVADSPSALVKGSEAIVSILADAAAVERGVRQSGADGEGQALHRDEHRAAGRCKGAGAKMRKQGGAYVECPVGGTTGPAREGKLFGFVGGEAADVARARPILDQMCRRVEHVGPVGAGSSIKLAINLPLIVYWQALGEALRSSGTWASIPSGDGHPRRYVRRAGDAQEPRGPRSPPRSAARKLRIPR